MVGAWSRRLPKKCKEKKHKRMREKNEEKKNKNSVSPRLASVLALTTLILCWDNPLPFTVPLVVIFNEYPEVFFHMFFAMYHLFLT